MNCSKLFFTIGLFLFAGLAYSQPVNQYFEKIRNNEAALTAFFTQMPKGGDLHHHYSGAIYTEPLLERAIAENFYVNTETMEVSKTKPVMGNWENFSNIQSRGELDKYKQKIIKKWSVKYYQPSDYPSDKLFFESFDKFWPAAKGHFEEGLLELKNRAVKENLSYIETQLTTIPCDLNTDNLQKWNSIFRQYETVKNEKAVFNILDTLWNLLLQKDIARYAQVYNTQFLNKLHQKLSIDDSHFTMRYQNFVLRFMEPVALFKNMMLAFISADQSELIGGVNLVSPEDGETSLKDYWLHMLMFQYCHSRFPNVKYSLHAGELGLGLVQPEQLTWHIRSAVYLAKANRIGHGVDIAYEDSSYQLLKYMAANKIPVEINLSSNEFILNVKDSRHPITLYQEFGVPIVISTDDPGILRTNMTEQYVLLAKRYKSFSYADIKEIVYNSIVYSFIKDPNIKKQIIKDLDERFLQFEAKFPL